MGAEKIKPWCEYKGVTLGALCARGHDHVDGKSYRDSFRACVECRAVSARSYHLANPECAQKAALAYAEKHRVDLAAKALAYRNAHPGWAHKTTAAWQKAHPEKVAEYNAAYKARKLGAMPPWADQDAITAVYEEAKRISKETRIQHVVDHIVPLKHDLVC